MAGGLRLPCADHSIDFRIENRCEAEYAVEL